MIVVKLDRLTRSVGDLCILLERLKKSGAELISISESLDTASAAGRLLVHILGSVNAWEREATG
jgi:DNA invertase Pin-like site-specific DNA recombinase